MDKEAQRKSLLALSERQGHYGCIDVNDVLTIMELRDEKIKELSDDYRKLPKDKPPLLTISSEEADECRGWAGQRRKFIEEKLEAQREADIKFYTKG